MPVKIGATTVMTKEDAIDGVSKTEVRHLLAVHRLCDAKTVDELKQYRAWVIYSEVRAVFRSRSPFHSHQNAERLPAPNNETYRALLQELKKVLAEPNPSITKAHGLVCQMLANGF